MSENVSKLTCSCPNGHRVRGDVKLQGSRVRCPKCRIAFVFASTVKTQTEPDAVSDTSIMRILGDPSHVGIPVVNRGIPATNKIERLRNCTRCGGATPKTLAICNHCSCYLGISSVDVDMPVNPSKVSS